MNRWIAFTLFVASVATPALASPPDPDPGLSADQIVGKNVAARGGLDAWRKIRTMAWVGHIESANVGGTPMPFVLELKRPNKTRFEIHVQNQKSVRMYDGTLGWKLRPSRSGAPDLQPYTPEELSFARDAQGIDGPLVDYQAKGISVALDGVEDVEGSRAYRLNVRLPSGAVHHVWIDAKSFLDVKSDRIAHNAFGMSGTVSVHYRDYRTVDGVKLPFLIESGGDSGKTTDKMVIDSIALNPPLDDWMFAKPRGLEPRHALRPGLSASRAAAQPDWRGARQIPMPGRPSPLSSLGAIHAQ